MSATAWLWIAIVGFYLSGIALVAAVAIFIRMDIPGAIRSLKGETAAEGNKVKREAKANDKKHSHRQGNANGGKPMEKVQAAAGGSSASLVAHTTEMHPNEVEYVPGDEGKKATLSPQGAAVFSGTEGRPRAAFQITRSVVKIHTDEVIRPMW